MTIAIEDADALVAHTEHLIVTYAGTCTTVSEIEDIRLTPANEMLSLIGPLLQQFHEAMLRLQRDVERVP